MSRARKKSCICGCGKWWVVVLTNRAQRHAKDCLTAKARQKQRAARQNSHSKSVSPRGNVVPREPGVPFPETNAGGGRPRISARPLVCHACANITDRRPKTGCPPRTIGTGKRAGQLLTCGLPYAEET